MGPPLRPPPAVAAAVGAQIAGCDDRVLLLGVTPELAALGRRLVAVDRHRGMIERHWAGDRDDRRVIVADWRNLPLSEAGVDAVVGDGCLTVLPSGEHRRVFAEIARVLRPGGRFVMRLFAAPENPETVAAVCADAMRGSIPNFWAFRWRCMMAAAAQCAGHDLPVVAGWRAFAAEVPDRDACARAAGWSRALVDTMDRYRDASDVYCFAPAAAVCASLPDDFVGVRLVATEGYDLAERCPLLVAERRT